MKQWLTLAILLGMVVVHESVGQEAAPEPESPPIHWATKIGLRSLQVEMTFPLLNRVVLVPDEATYADELAKWSPSGRWPVLFEDDFLAPMFIRRFQPARIIVRESVGALPGKIQERREQLEVIVKSAWGGSEKSQSLMSLFQQQGFVPPGVVIASTEDPAWTAAVALAAGRGQPLLWLDDDYGLPGAALNEIRGFALKNQIEEAITELGLVYAGLGEGIETITLCRSLAGRVQLKLPEDQTLPVPEQYRSGPYAITDFLGRNQDWKRDAFTGWIFGDEKRCAYVAMCSLFLQRHSFDLFNSYDPNGARKPYAMGPVAEILTQRGYEVRHREASKFKRSDWAQLLTTGFSCDVLMMNSHGGGSNFHLSDGSAQVLDVPLHNLPVAVHLIHSWSMVNPADSAVVSGRWLDHGAYAFVGAMHEPLLYAFMTPTTLGERFYGMVPLLIAARWWDTDGMFSRPWRVNTFGDPLMLCNSPQEMSRPRITQEKSYGTDLSTRVRDLLQQVKTEPDQEVYVQAIRNLVLLGRDDMAIELWKLAQHHNLAQPSATHVLGPLFRAGNKELFLEAWEMLVEPNELTRDMLWHLLGPRLGPRVPRRLLVALESGIRKSFSHEDARKLAPHIDREFSRQRTRSMLTGLLEVATNKTSRQALGKLLESYPQ